MKKSLFNKIKGYIGILMIILAVATIYFWETYGREELLYEEVITFNTEVTKNTLITEELAKNIVTVIKTDKANIIDEPIIDINKIIGKEAKQYIPRNAQLSPKYFDEPELVLNEDEYIFSIPKEWVYAFPSSLRRKDIIYLYKTKDNGIDINSNVSTINETLVGFENKNIQVKNYSSDDLILSAAVAYVKDSANREVVDVNNNERLDGSAKIDEIEIVTTKEKVKILQELFNSGYRFIIMYQ